MSSFKMFTDSCSDLPESIARQYDIGIAPLSVDLDGDTYDDRTRPAAQLYTALRAGKMAKTAAVNPERWVSQLEPSLKAGQDILVINFPAAMSTTHQSAVIAAEELQEKYPDRKILVVDSLSACSGQSLLLLQAARMREKGAQIDEVYQWIMDNRLHACHWVTVDDLMFLKKGGRLSASSAVVGTMLKVKPLIVVNEEGGLSNVGKVRGRKAALNAIVDKVAETALPELCDTMFLHHSDCAEDAEYVAQQVKERTGINHVVIDYIGSVIGSHVGPGALVAGFMGSKR